MKQYKDIDEYIRDLPAERQKIIQKIRKTIKNAAPKATEAIRYGIPTFRLNGNLVHFAAFAQHIGFYPTPSAIAEFARELSAYKTSKGAIQFLYDEPIPYELIKKIVKFRVSQI